METLKDVIGLLEKANQNQDWELVKMATKWLRSYVDNRDKAEQSVRNVYEIDFRKPLRSPYMEKVLGLKKNNGYQIVTYESEWGKLAVLERTLKGHSLITLKSKYSVKKIDDGTR